MWQGGRVHCRPGPQRRELPVLVSDRESRVTQSSNNYHLVKIHQSNKVVTFVFVEHCKGGGGGVGVPQPHSPVCWAGKESLVYTAVHQTPDWVSVSTQSPTQHNGVCRQRSTQQCIIHRGIITQTFTSVQTVMTLNGYRRSRMGRC